MNKKRKRGDGNPEEGKRERKKNLQSEPNSGSIIPVAKEEESLKAMTIQTRNEAREKIATWERDQIAVRVAHMMWMGRKKQLLMHENSK
jgi:hypothetical protein